MNIGNDLTNIAPHICRIPTLEILDLSHNDIQSNTALEALGNIIQMNISILRLDIRNNNIRQGIRTIADALKQNNSIVELILRSCQINGNGFCYLADALMYNNTISLLDCSVNNIGDNGLIAISESLKKNNSISELYMEGCSLGNIGAEKFLETLLFRDIVTVDLSNNLIDTDLWNFINSIVNHRGDHVTIETRKGSSDDTNQTLKLLLDNNENDLRWRYLFPNSDKRRKLMEEVSVKPSLEWAIKNGGQLWINEIKSNEYDSKQLIGASIWSSPMHKKDIPFSTLAVGAFKIFLSLGLKNASRIKKFYGWLEEKILLQCPPNAWMLVWLEVNDACEIDLAIWKELLRPVFRQADLNDEPIWGYVSDREKLEFYKRLGFQEHMERLKYENTFNMYTFIRYPMDGNDADYNRGGIYNTF
eukprot:TRINITY_DN9834_c0_g1_i1.p1 TRINITY_DN9834_c0_g1~~TRINITY_DN9834_c0_g1_i1.p1  ORF type:complete len:418 (-),score=75.11 TRINITY_DN9834_c0_g1_i1:36-1289(-)